MSEQIHKYEFDNPEIFERGHRDRFQRESDFLLELFGQHGGISRVLDAACGTGGHAGLLAQAGLQVAGVDLNPNMVAFARQHRPGLPFLVADMRDLPFRGAFDALTCLCTSFCYNTTNESVAAALQAFRRALKPGGLAVIDVFNPIALLEKRSFLKEIRDEQHYAALGLYAINQVRVDERAQLLVERRTIHALEDDREVHSDLTCYRLFFPQELRYFLESCGFDRVHLYGDFDLNRTDLEGTRLIAAAGMQSTGE